MAACGLQFGFGSGTPNQNILEWVMLLAKDHCFIPNAFAYGFSPCATEFIRGQWSKQWPEKLKVLLTEHSSHVSK